MTMTTAPLIGVLALQGASDAHCRMLEQLGARVRNVRRPADLDGLDGLILPGGESTAMLRLMDREGLFEPLRSAVQSLPCLGTCAGTILLAETVEPAQSSFAALPITVTRNAYGRQNDSAILNAQTALDGGPLEMVFIRAPRIDAVGEGVTVLARRGDDPVLVQKGHTLACTFHPELGSDPRVHAYFLAQIGHH